MDFCISDTFADSLARLTSDEQKAVKTTAFDLQVNPANSGMQFHKLDRAKDKNFWSVRVNRDVRLIVHKTAATLLLCYVDHHDDAYDWAERRKIERHPATGAAQLVEIRERVQEVIVPRYVDAPAAATPTPKPAKAKPLLFKGVKDDDLLEYGVPPEWLADARAATEDTLLTLADHLPPEAAEALLDLAVGAKPKVAEPVAVGTEGFDHPDARRRFRLMTNADELAQALDYSWEKWSVFLHPAQEEMVERAYSGPARVAGSAGTGKTVVALHRAAFLARRHPDAKVLVTTFSDPLANALRAKVRVLLGNDAAALARVTVRSLDGVGIDLYTARFGPPKVADEATVRQLIREAAAAVPGHKYPERFLRGEWDEVVDAWQLRSWEEYRDVSRLGRKTRLGEKQRQVLWQILGKVREGLAARGLMTIPDIFAKVTESLAGGGAAKRPFEFVVVYEAQDVGVAQLRFLAALAKGRPAGLFFTGDLGQRIFQTPFSWKALGVDERGRSLTLRINYRMSHQIRRYADRLLPDAVSDVDGNADERGRTISVFNGPDPQVRIEKTEAAEAKAVAAWLKQLASAGLQPHEIGIFVRTDRQLPRARAALNHAGLKYVELDDRVETRPGHVSVATMQAAKGLEFRAVVAMACDDDVIPLEGRVEAIADDADLEEVYTSERHLLYVACTRARDQLLLTAVTPGSEFLGDLSVR